MLDERHRDGDILEAVNDEIDFAIKQGLLQLADKEALAAQLVEWAVGDLVAGSFESCDIDAKGGVNALEGIYDELRLSKRQGGASGAEAESCF